MFSAVNPVPELLSEGPGQWQTSMVFPANYPYFQGHFPTQPILPAVVTLGLSLELLRGLVDFQGWELKSSKFTQPILPNQRVQIQIQRRETESTAEYKITWTIDESETANLPLRPCAEINYSINLL